MRERASGKRGGKTAGKRTVCFETVLSFFEETIVGEGEGDSSVGGVDEGLVSVHWVGKALQE